MGNISSSVHAEDRANDLFSINITPSKNGTQNSTDDLYFRESEEPLRQRDDTNIVDIVRSLSNEKDDVSTQDSNRNLNLKKPMKRKLSQLNAKNFVSRFCSTDKVHSENDLCGTSITSIWQTSKPGIVGSGYLKKARSCSRTGFNRFDSNAAECVAANMKSNPNLIAPRTRFISKSYSNSSVSIKESHSVDYATKFNNGEQALKKRESLPSLRLSSSSPHSYRLIQKEVINQTMQERLMVLQKSLKNTQISESAADKTPKIAAGNRMTKETRNKRRAEHNQAIIDDLCDIVTDLFTSEQSLFVHDEDEFQIEGCANKKKSIMKSVRKFLSDLPIRYALGVETPSEVLVHMRLVAAARSDDYHAAIHVVKLEKSMLPYRNYSPDRDLKLVTISCSDRHGLLEYITGKLLATGGSRVLDADVMTITENIVLDRFVVEMNGRLRLDKLKQCIEQYLRESEGVRNDERCLSPISSDDKRCGVRACFPHAANSAYYSNGSVATCGQIYHQNPTANVSKQDSIKKEVQLAVPLSEVISCSNSNIGNIDIFSKHFPSQLRKPALKRNHSAPVRSNTASFQSSGESSGDKVVERPGNGNGSPRAEYRDVTASNFVENRTQEYDGTVSGMQRGLLDTLLQEDNEQVPNIPPDDLKLIEKLGSGRISTVYRAIWQKRLINQSDNLLEEVALKVCLADDPSNAADNISEFSREADIASSLDHFNICKIVGVVRENDCCCLAYEYCEGGTLKNLLSDPSRCYEYLPIALDIANGMAYLHSRNVIHRDLKPANILLTKGNRAKIADFGMSVANTGQELTAETGTYRWMAPEVIRHESYSSNADVFSFGVVLWQLISREVPFTTLTPVQTAYAVAEGYRPEIPSSTPEQLRRIILACWDADTERRPSFTYIAMALADYAKMAFSPANVGAQTVQIADDMLANVSGNSTVNVDFSVPMTTTRQRSEANIRQRGELFANQSDSAIGQGYLLNRSTGSYSSNIGLPI